MNLPDAAAFIARLGAIRSSAEVGAEFSRSIAPSGFLAAACGASRETPQGKTWDFLFNTWPPDWLRQYLDNDYVRYDPAPTLARVTAYPFTWRELVVGEQRSEKHAQFRSWVTGLGVVDGFVVPIHLPGGDFGLCVSLADHPIEDPNERLALHMVSLYAHRRCRELGGPVESSSVKAPFSPREIECLRWATMGKSDRDIAAILEISHTTAHFHIERIKKKLGVKTRAQAAAALVALGYL